MPPSATALQSYRHVVTVDAALLGRVGIDVEMGSLGLRLVGAGGRTSTGVLMSPTPFAATKCDGLPLFATMEMSLPPFAAICLYGDNKVAEWLASLGLQRHQYVSAWQEPEAEAYAAFHFEHSPLSREDIDAVIGGWHDLWMDDDFYLGGRSISFVTSCDCHACIRSRLSVQTPPLVHTGSPAKTPR